MEDFTQLFDFLRMTSSGISGVGIIAVLFFLWKSGLIQFRKSNGQSNGHGQEHDKLWDALTDLRENHLHSMQEDISDIRGDVQWIKGKLDK